MHNETKLADAILDRWAATENDAPTNAESEHIKVGLTQHEIDQVFEARVTELKSCLGVITVQDSGLSDMDAYWRALYRVRQLETSASPDLVASLTSEFAAYAFYLDADDDEE